MSQQPKDLQLAEEHQQLPPSSPQTEFLNDFSQNSDNGDQQQENRLPSPRPLRKYSRHQLVALSNSPLITQPPNMPELKVWFGYEIENTPKKDESPTPSSARERRFRRDEDGDTPARTSFRSALTQPSQMGNFKHQSLRPNDRDRERERERDGDKERERDFREKDGERLRHLADKFDRDKLALPLTTRKERDSAAHLHSNSARAPQALASTTGSRRAEHRETGKKKVNESNEDWRRGADPVRSTREDRVENSRRDDRASSIARDSSINKRETSPSRRERDDTKERGPRNELERDESRREKDDSRRDRNVDEDDPRRWRDDGKRELRLAARRDRARDKAIQDPNWDGDKRWASNDDREGRYKRGSTRDRKSGNGHEDVKDERREKEREKEKEPAWMDTYIPNDDAPGILGGQSASGELDGIQAYKKGMREKESKEKEATVLSVSSGLEGATSPVLPTPPMDEIQLFKRMMKEEEEKKKLERNGNVVNDQIPFAKDKDGDLSNLHIKYPENDVLAATPFLPRKSDGKLPMQTSSVSKNLLPSSVVDTSPFMRSTTDLISPLAPADFPKERNITLINKSVSPEPPHQNGMRQTGDYAAPNTFQPPQGSRLLAFGRPKGGNAVNVENGLQSFSTNPQNSPLEPVLAYPPNEPLRPGLTPFEDQTRHSNSYDESRDTLMPLNQVNQHHRLSADLAFNPNLNSQGESNYSGITSAKGSRFVKFFEGKPRDVMPSGKQHSPGVYLTPSPGQNQRDQSGFTGRTSVDDLLAKLSSSTNRTNMGQHSITGLNNNFFSSQGHPLQPPQHLQQAQHQNNILEALYDSRGDDRSFVPDGLVPGLRPIPPPPLRGRESGHFMDQIDDSMHYNMSQRMVQPQPQSLSSHYPGPAPSIYPQQSGRHVGLAPQPLPQPAFRPGPSNINPGGPVSNIPNQQRLPPGLANLGRPPHDPSQFLGVMPPTGNLNPSSTSGPLQQQLAFNHFNVVNNGGFNPSHVHRTMHGPPLHNAAMNQHGLGNISNIAHADPRVNNNNHHLLIGHGGPGVGGNRMNNGFSQPVPVSTQLPGRQPQPQPPLPPHILPHHPPVQSGNAQDLINLLLSHRE